MSNFLYDVLRAAGVRHSEYEVAEVRRNYARARLHPPYVVIQAMEDGMVRVLLMSGGNVPLDCQDSGSGRLIRLSPQTVIHEDDSKEVKQALLKKAAGEINEMRKKFGVAFAHLAANVTAAAMMSMGLPQQEFPVEFIDQWPGVCLA